MQRPSSGEQLPFRQKLPQSESLVQGLGAHWPAVQVKLAVQSEGWAQVAAMQRCVALHAMLGPQSVAVAQPLVQRFCGWAPP